MKSIECIICRSMSKYKCPKCESSYCSVSCYKQHLFSCKKQIDFSKDEKNKEQNIQVDQNPVIKTDYVEDETARLGQNDLNKLKNNKKLIEILSKHQLQQKLKQIDNSRQRITELHKAMLDQNFMCFVEQVCKCLPKDQQI